MNSFHKININSIASIKSYFKLQCLDYYYQEEERIWYFWKKKAGFYERNWMGSDKLTTVEKIQESGKFIVIGKEVFHKPHITIKLNDGKSYDKYFNTKEELISFMESDEIKGINWTNI